MMFIKQSKTADTRSCSFSQVTKETLHASSLQHIDDVKQGLKFFKAKLDEAASRHDHDKLSGIDQFHADFITGFAQKEWWDNHRKVNRHHLMHSDGIPSDVNLIDVLEMIVDCVMAGMGRAGNVYPLEINQEILLRAFHNTTELLKSQVVVEDDEQPASL